jgi:hypothetical protein
MCHVSTSKLTFFTHLKFPAIHNVFINKMSSFHPKKINPFSSLYVKSKKIIEDAEILVVMWVVEVSHCLNSFIAAAAFC